MAFGPDDGREWIMVDITVVDNTNGPVSTTLDLPLEYFVNDEYYVESCGMLEDDYRWHGDLQPGHTVEAMECLHVAEGGLDGVWRVTGFSLDDVAESDQLQLTQYSICMALRTSSKVASARS